MFPESREQRDGHGALCTNCTKPRYASTLITLSILPATATATARPLSLASEFEGFRLWVRAKLALLVYCYIRYKIIDRSNFF